MWELHDANPSQQYFDDYLDWNRKGLIHIFGDLQLWQFDQWKNTDSYRMYHNGNIRKQTKKLYMMTS